MDEQQAGETPGGFAAADMEAYARSFQQIAEKSQKLVADFLARQPEAADSLLNTAGLGEAFLALSQKMLANPAKLAEAQWALWQDYVNLWQAAAKRMAGSDDAAPAIQPDRGDKRFKDPAWNENQTFDFLKQSYLLTSRWIQNTVHGVEGLDEKTRQKVDFFTRQFVDAMSPSNFMATNPEVLRATYETRGENLVKGLDHLLADLERGRVTMVEPDAFVVGKDVAVTPGKVVYQNPILQLLQYSPATPTVHARPLLIVPPCINKFYILDLRPRNSMVKWLTEQGFTVFLVSWVNADPSLAETTFDDYMTKGVIGAIDATLKASGAQDLNLLGYCVGGTLSAAALSWMKARNDARVHSVSFLTALMDFSDAGEITVFIDGQQLQLLDEHMREKGVFDGRIMAQAFNALRANDLVWSFVVNNYLLGKEPFPFDILFWNSDSTNLPAAMYSFYLHKMYHENQLCRPGALKLGGIDIDLGTIDLPMYVLATKEDHISPWRSCYRTTQLMRGPSRFVLVQSGHVAGVVNPPGVGKYGHWTNDTLPADPEAWFKGATQHPGSWWENWAAWLRPHSGEQVPARVPGGALTGTLPDTPGSYVTKAQP